MSALAVYFGFNLEKLSARKENWTQLDENNDAFKREESGTLAASSPSMLTSPVRAFLERNNANETSNRTLVPEPESPLSNLRTQEDEHRKRVFTITNWIGKGLGLAVSAIYLLDLYYIRKNDVALKTCLLTTACVALGGHFLTAAFRESPPKWGKYELVPSSLFGVLFIAAVVLAVQLTEDFGLYYAFALWPVVTLIVSCDTHKAIPDSTIKMVNPDALGLERTDTLAFGQGILPPPSRQCVPLGAIAWRLTRTFNLIVIRSTWFISLIYGGLYLPLALNTILISSAVAISANLKVKNKWTYLTFLVLALVGILLSSVALSAVLPIFMTKSYNTDSIGFIQRQGKPYSQLAPVQNISGLYIDNEVFACYLQFDLLNSI